MQKDPYEVKYQLLINSKSSLKHFNEAKDFIECSNEMQDVYENIEEYKPQNKRKLLIDFDDMTGDMSSDRKIKLHSYWTVY